MKVLLVEDDENKRTEVARFVKSLAPGVVVSEGKSYQAAQRLLQSDVFDRVILDMTLPTFDITRTDRGGRPQAYGGRDLLRLMKRRGIVTPTVVLTQFDRFGEGENLRTFEELDQQLRREQGPSYLGAVFYNVAEDTWRHQLRAFILEGWREEAEGQ